MIALYYGRYNGNSTSTWLYILLLIMIGVSMYASAKVNSNFSKFAKKASKSGLTGREVAKIILNRNGIYDVNIEPISGNLTDHFDPRTNVIRLSENVYDETSISAISVAAHEVGHAIQANEEYLFLQIRSNIAPIVQFTSSFTMFLIIIGFILNFSGLIDIGIILFSFSVLFHIITLPVEFDASRRALVQLEENKILTIDEISDSKKVLSAAAMTYIASALVSLIQLLRFISMRRD